MGGDHGRAARCPAGTKCQGLHLGSSWPGLGLAMGVSHGIVRAVAATGLCDPLVPWASQPVGGCIQDTRALRYCWFWPGRGRGAEMVHCSTQRTCVLSLCYCVSSMCPVPCRQAWSHLCHAASCNHTTYLCFGMMLLRQRQVPTTPQAGIASPLMQHLVIRRPTCVL